MKSLGVPEKGFILLLVVSACVALVTPTPLLQSLNLGIDSRIFPVTLDEGSSGFELRPENGGARIEQEFQRGCIRLRARNGQSTGPICNRHLRCEDSTKGAAGPSAFEVFKLPAPNAFYVETGSACNSACCDWRGMSFSGDGRRLDDGVLQRLSLRLGIPGLVALAAGFLCLLRTLRTGLRLSLRVGTLAGLGSAIAMLWWNL